MEMTAPVYYKYENLDDGTFNVTMSFYVSAPDAPQPVLDFAALKTMAAGTKFYVR